MLLNPISPGFLHADANLDATPFKAEIVLCAYDVFWNNLKDVYGRSDARTIV